MSVKRVRGWGEKSNRKRRPFLPEGKIPYPRKGGHRSGTLVLKVASGSTGGTRFGLRGRSHHKSLEKKRRFVRCAPESTPRGAHRKYEKGVQGKKSATYTGRGEGKRGRFGQKAINSRGEIPSRRVELGGREYLLTRKRNPVLLSPRKGGNAFAVRKKVTKGNEGCSAFVGEWTAL